MDQLVNVPLNPLLRCAGSLLRVMTKSLQLSHLPSSTGAVSAITETYLAAL